MEPIVIHSGDIRADISPLGAELVRLVDGAGTDWLHDGKSFWTGHSPLLFPIVGSLAGDSHQLDGRTYRLARHGFARRMPFEVLEVDTASVSLIIEENAATLAEYPYRFRLVMSYRVAGSSLAMEAAVINTDQRPIPVAFGFHPAFRWPLPGGRGKDGTALIFEAEEDCPVERLDGAGLIERTLPPLFTGTTLDLADELFDDDALIFLDLKSRALTFRHKDEERPALGVEWRGLTHLGVWTKPGGAPYLCIEPWQGYASRKGFAGSLIEKPGSVILQPGEEQTFAMTVTLKP